MTGKTQRRVQARGLANARVAHCSTRGKRAGQVERALGSDKNRFPRQQLQFSRPAILGVKLETPQVVRCRAHVHLGRIRKLIGLNQLFD